MRSHKKSVVISLIILSVAMVTAMAALRSQNQNTSKSPIQEEPTMVQEGVMTAKQKEHSKIYRGYRNRPKIKDQIAQVGDVKLIAVVGDVGVPRDFSLHNYMQDLTCKSDVVVLGTVKSKSSQLVEDGTFTFTDYEMVTEEILKDNSAAPIQQGNITITRPGGAVKLNGHTVRAIDYRSEPLQVGERYLLFLQFVPSTGAYKSFSDSFTGDSFQILNGKVVQVSKKPLPLGAHGTTEASLFLNEVHTALNNYCGGVK